MDGISAASAVLTLVGTVSGIARVAKIIYQSPAEMLELCNEISDLHAITADLHIALERDSVAIQGSERLIASLQNADAVLKSLDAFMRQRLLNSNRTAEVAEVDEPLQSGHLSRRKWLLARRRITSYKAELKAINRELSGALQTLHFHISARVEMRLSNVAAFSQTTSQILDDHRQCTAEFARALSRLNRDIKDEDADNALAPDRGGDDQVPPRQLGQAPAELEMQLTWQPPVSCAPQCQCACHKSVRGRSHPALDTLLGILFWSTTGYGATRQKCDLNACSRQGYSTFRLSYFFPAWYVRRAFHLTLQFLPIGGPQAAIKAVRLVDHCALIYHLIHLGDNKGIQRLFKHNMASPADTSYTKWSTPLHCAVQRGDIELINLFLTNQADQHTPDVANRTPASLAWDIVLTSSKPPAICDNLAVIFGNSEVLEDYQFSRLHEVVLEVLPGSIVEELEKDPCAINAIDKCRNTPLIWAARRGHVGNVRKLLQYGANATAKNDVGEDALIEAVFFNRYDCMSALLDVKAPITVADDGKNILHHACKLRDDVAFVRRILETGIDINVPDGIQRTPLALASSPNHHKTVKFLLEREANIEARDGYGSTPILRAVRYGSLDTSRLLLSHGADYTAVDVDNKGILHKAAVSGDERVFQFLVDHGLRGLQLDLKDRFGQSPFDALLETRPDAQLMKAFQDMLQKLRQTNSVGESSNDGDAFHDAREYAETDESGPRE